MLYYGSWTEKTIIAYHAEDARGFAADGMTRRQTSVESHTSDGLPLSVLQEQYIGPRQSLPAGAPAGVIIKGTFSLLRRRPRD